MSKKVACLLTSKPCKAQYALDALLLNQLYKTPRIPDARPICPHTKMYGSECCEANFGNHRLASLTFVHTVYKQPLCVSKYDDGS